MKFSVKQLRIAMIVVNLALAIGFTLHYAYGVAPEYLPFTSDEAESKVAALEPPANFRFRENLRRKKVDPAAEMRVVGVYLQPVKKLPPPPPPVKDPDEVEPVDETIDDGPTEGGPLARDWEYVGGIIHASNPRFSRIRLQKKPEEAPKSSSSSKSSTSRYKSKYQSKYQSSRSRRSGAKQGETIYITLDDRHYVDEENELDFFVDHVDADKLVYWTDNDPKKMYQLSYKHESPYLMSGRTERLISPAKDEDEDEDEEEKKHIILRPLDYEDLREDDYQRLRKGEKPEGHLQAVDLTEKRNASKSSSSRSKYDRGKTSSSSSKKPYGSKSSSSSGSSKSSATKSSATKSTTPKSQAEQMKELGGTMKDVLKSDKASAEDKKAIRELQKVIKGDKSKRR